MGSVVNGDEVWENCGFAMKMYDDWEKKKVEGRGVMGQVVDDVRRRKNAREFSEVRLRMMLWTEVMVGRRL